MPHGNATVVHRPAIEVVGLTTDTCLREITHGVGVKPTEADYWARRDQIAGRSGSETYLVQLYPDVPEFNDDTRFQVVIGAPVEPGSPVPDGMIRHIIPAGEYLSVTHVGPETELTSTYHYLNRVAMREAGRDPLGFDYEVWDQRYKPESPENEIEIFVAVR